MQQRLRRAQTCMLLSSLWVIIHPKSSQSNSWSEPWLRRHRLWCTPWMTALRWALWVRSPSAVTDLPLAWQTVIQVWFWLSHWATGWSSTASFYVLLPFGCKLSCPLSGQLLSWLWYSISTAHRPKQESASGRIFTSDTPCVTDCCYSLENTPQFSTGLYFCKLTFA